eukprot:5605648-Alexandrium_andersonii.AAC.1
MGSTNPVEKLRIEPRRSRPGGLQRSAPRPAPHPATHTPPDDAATPFRHRDGERRPHGCGKCRKVVGGVKRRGE